ncbi:hypothetical protein RWE15_23785 [Virgibacillus halophilus]|uniref:Uncharacterized protein n=1 Tax=Tigheibacillus halophilus TaxID=361280 RepID=A0ABU5CE19_9BACI|nr:hypothetical protein [Virgibacillus halophilus]
MAVSMRALFENEQKVSMNDFFKNFDTMHLWASDEVMNSLNNFIDALLASDTQEILQQRYATTILEMRKDAGFNDSKLNSNDYKFISANQKR